MISLVDTHAHLDQKTFDSDRAEVVERAVAAGVGTIITIGVDVASSEAAIGLARQFSAVRAAVGIQPNDCGDAAPGDWDRIVALAEQPGVVALGETGLDLYWKRVPLDMQQDYFDRHLRLSAERGLPFIVHMRDCDAEVLAMLREARRRQPLHGVMHSFTGTPATAAECVELGMYISFAGMVTFKKSEELRAIAASVPADRILVETDSPYLSPEPRRGKRNEPAHVVHTAQLLAEVRGVPFAEFARQTTANARQLFSLL